MLYFCRRGQENLRELRKDSFGIGVDSAGARYVFQKRDELTKNRRENSEAEGGLMLERKGDPMCPVQSMDMYMSRLNPQCEHSFSVLRSKFLKVKPSGMTTKWLVSTRLEGK